MLTQEINEDYYALCTYCGSEVYPTADPDKLKYSATKTGYCFRCGANNVILISVRDYRFASSPVNAIGFL